MPGLYGNGFSLNDWNKDKRNQQRRESQQAAADERDGKRADELFQVVLGGKMVTLTCGKNEDGVIRMLKNKMRGDNRFAWNYTDTRVHFTKNATKEPTKLRRPKTE